VSECIKNMSRRSKRRKKNFQKIISSQPSQKENKHESSTSSHNQPTGESQDSRTIVQSSTNEQQWQEDQKDYWRRQIRQGKILNCITACATVAGFITLYFLNATFQRSVNAVKLQQRAWVVVADDGP